MIIYSAQCLISPVWYAMASVWSLKKKKISQLLGVPLKTHVLGTRLYISERLSSPILQDRLARLRKSHLC